MFLGYNTNGLAHHDPLAACDLLAELGYRGVALTLDHYCANPYTDVGQRQQAAIGQRLQSLGMRSAIETGARFLLDPRVKHEPTLVSPLAAQRAARVDFLCRAIDAAAQLSSDCVSFWSGVVHDGAPLEVCWNRLLDGLRETLDYADRRQVTLAFEPEPGMFIDTMARFDEMLARLGPAPLRLTLDIGHLHCQGETPLPDYIRRWSRLLAHVHLEDMRAGVHEHLPFGAGEIDFVPVIDALRSVGYEGGVYVELSRQSHEGPVAARQAMEFLRPLLEPQRPTL